MADSEKKRRWGDRWDATWLRNIDSMHAIMPYVYPNRADNEAFIQETVDLTALNRFLEEKNRDLDKAHRYTIFHCVACALVKVITLRPEMNNFMKGGRLYHRNDVSVAFVVRKQMKDGAKEALAYKKFGPETTIDTFHERIMKLIFESRDESKVDNTTGFMDIFMKFPRWLLRPLFFIIRRLDFFGKVPRELIKADPNYASVFLTNLGSIKLNACYHHLTNWGTCSIFAVIGLKHIEPKFNEDGTYSMVDTLHFGITLDERIADGYYYSKSIALFKYILEHPEYLDRPANEEVEM